MIMRLDRRQAIAAGLSSLILIPDVFADSRLASRRAATTDLRVYQTVQLTFV